MPHPEPSCTVRFYWMADRKNWLVEATYPLPGGRAAGSSKRWVDATVPMDGVTIRKLLDVLKRELEGYAPWL